MAKDSGKVITACGAVEPAVLGKVLMHEHIHGDVWDSARDMLVDQERPMPPDRREFLLREALPWLKKLNDYGCHALVEVSVAPGRAWPTFLQELTRLSRTHIIQATGFYREVELGSYWATKPEYQIWPFVRQASVEELAEYCVREIVEGINGTGVRAGAIKLATSQPTMTEAEEKAFRAGAAAQKATGVHVTTHCTVRGAESSQLKLLQMEGVDLRRVVIGHTTWHLMNRVWAEICIDWMKRGANFLPTNLFFFDPKVRPGHDKAAWQSLVDGINRVFDAGQGDKLVLGLDSGFGSEDKTFKFLGFSHTLRAFREMGLTEQQEDIMIRLNPRRILPVQ
jgi:phosphotriesterase-related protein